jgi:thiol-disulfide isomerase/thioredoxin/predicted CopG family antitoxin
MADKLNGQYCVHLTAVDTVCSIGENGEKICKLVERHDSILFKAMNNSYVFKLKEYDDIALVNTFNEVVYQPTNQLPEPKTGIAVLQVQYLGNPQDVAGKTIKAATNNIWFMNQMSYSSNFNNKGYAILEVPMAQAQPVYATLKNYGRIFLSPGDTLYAAFDGAWAAKLENVIWMGKNAQINYDLSRYDNKFWGMAEFTNESRNILNRPIDEYKQARANITNKIRNRDKEYFQANSCSPGFIELTEIGNQVQEWEDFMRFRWMPERFRTGRVEFPIEYFDFLKEIDYHNKKYWYSENMAWFLSEVNNWLSSANQTEQIKVSVIDVIENILSKNELPDSTREAIHIYLNHQKVKLGEKLISEIIQEFINSSRNEIDSVYIAMENKEDFDIIEIFRKNQTTYNTEEFEIIENWMNASKSIIPKDVQMLVNNNMNSYYAEQRKQRSFSNIELISASDETKELFKIMISLKEFSRTLESMNEKEIRDGYAGLQMLDIPSAVLRIVNQQYTEKLEIIAQPMPGDVNLETVAPGSADEFMAKLAQKHEGKVVYIDVWAPWCGPCRSEFQYAPQLKKKFEGKDVVFVYICGSGEKDAWENCIKQYKVNGDHYYVEGNTYNELQKKYSINGIPHFMIMDKQGIIVDFKSSRPSNLDETTRRLNSYL